MAMTAYGKNYDFHQETLHDVQQLVTNNTTRKVLHNELVYLDGFFGEVCEIDGIAASASGYISINPNRTIRSAQVADAALMDGDFTVGSTMYFIPQVNANEGYLVDQNDVGAPAIPVGIIVGVPGDSNDWVTFRPFPQPRDVLALSAAIDTLNANVSTAGSVLKLIKDNGQNATYTNTASGLSAVTVKTAVDETVALVATEKAAVIALVNAIPHTVELVIDADATGGIDFANEDTGLAVGDKIIDIHVIGDAISGSGTLKLSHGDGGADISAALTCAEVGVITRAAIITGGVVTADGLTITANGAADEGRMYVTYIKA